MSKVVFILGAGASKTAGAPLMKDFFDRARRFYTNGSVKEFNDDFERVFKAISELQAAHSKASLDVYNLESVFNAFEFAEFLEINKNNFNSELVSSLKRVIAATIEQSMVFPVEKSSNKSSQSSHRTYQKFINLIKLSLENNCKVSLLNFNYDIAPDFELVKQNIKFDYCLNDQELLDNVIPVLKLHGSLNWRKCSKCKKISSFDIKKYFSQNGDPSMTGMNGELIKIGTSPLIYACDYCNNPTENIPFIVPPSWNKQEHYKMISPVWRRAAKELKEAIAIFICGYSLPQTDQFFHNLYALGTMGGNILQSNQVINPDNSGEVENRFKKLIGTGVLERFSYPANNNPDVGTFDSAIIQIGGWLRQSVWT